MITKEILIKEIEKAGSDHLKLFGGKYVGNHFIQQQPHELAELILFLANYKKEYTNSLEIGIAAGGTTRFIRNFIKIHNTIIIDDGNHPNFGKYLSNNKYRINSRIYEFIGNSHSKKANLFLKSFEVKLNYVAIDGDHSYEGVKQDFELVLPYLSKDCIVWFHDTIFCAGVKKFLEEIKNKYEFVLQIYKKFGITVIKI